MAYDDAWIHDKEAGIMCRNMWYSSVAVSDGVASKKNIHNDSIRCVYLIQGVY